MSIPGVERGPWAAVYLRTIDQLRTDPVLDRVVKTWIVGDGPPEEPIAAVEPAALWLALQPEVGAGSWFSPDEQRADLNVRMDALLSTFESADCLDFMYAVMRAIYPKNNRDKQLSFESQLRKLGAETGQWTFTQPLSIQVADGKAGLYRCTGVMSISVTRPLNP